MSFKHALYTVLLLTPITCYATPPAVSSFGVYVTGSTPQVGHCVSFSGGFSIQDSGVACNGSSNSAPINSPTFTGTVTIPLGASIAGYETTTSAALLAPINSPTFTGNPLAPSLTLTDSSQQLVYSAWVQSNLPFISLATYGVKGTNSTTTNDADIAAACTALGTKGGTLVFPIGSFQVNNAITCGTNIVWYKGQGPGITNVQQYTSGGSDAFLFTKSGQSFGGVEGMSITQCSTASGCTASPVSPTPSAGCAIDLQNGSNIIIRNIVIKQFYNGVCQTNVGNNIVDSVYISNYINDAFYTNTQVFGFYTNTYANTQTALNSNASYEFVNSQGFRMTNCGGSNAYYGVLFDPGLISGISYQSIGTADIDNCNFDSANDIGMEINTTGGGVVYQIHVVNTGFSFAGNPGVGIGVQTQGPANTIANISFDNVNVNRDGAQGYQLLSGASVVQITGGQIDSNNTLSGGSNICGVEVDNINNLILSNNEIGTYLSSNFSGPPSTSNATITSSNSLISGTNSFAAGQQLVFTTTVGNLVSGTVYYVISAGLTTSTFEVSATNGGTAIIPSASGSSVATAGGSFPGSPSYAGNNQCGVLINSSFTGVASLTNNIIQTNSGYDLKQLSSSANVRITGYGTIGLIDPTSIIPCQKSTATIASGGSSVAVTFPFTFSSAPAWINAGPFIVSNTSTTGFTASTLSGTVSGNKTFAYDAELTNTSCQ